MADIVKDLAADRPRSHKAERVAAAIVDMGFAGKPASAAMGSWRGDAVVYPASIVKTFYMGAAFAWAREGRFDLNPAVKQDIKYMIEVSSNAATQRVLNRLCDVSPGPLLSQKDFKAFAEKRNRVNRWLSELGLQKTNACQGTWDGAPSPRDMQLMTMRVDAKGPAINHNKTTADDMAFFLWLIATDRIGAPEDGEAMRKLMERKPDSRSRPGYRKIFQDELPKGTTLWGKSGYTSDTSHDSAIITTKDGRRFVLVVLTEVYYDTSSFLGDFAVEAAKRLERIAPSKPAAGRKARAGASQPASAAASRPASAPASQPSSAPAAQVAPKRPGAKAGKAKGFWPGALYVLKLKWLAKILGFANEKEKQASPKGASTETKPGDGEQQTPADPPSKQSQANSAPSWARVNPQACRLILSILLGAKV